MAHLPSLCCGILLLLSPCLLAQPGTLDNDFGDSGKVTTAFGNEDDSGQSVAVQPDGKIIVAGFTDDGTHDLFALARYLPDGVLDPAFSGDGRQTTTFGVGDHHAYAVALQPDGKIVVAGYATINGEFDFAVARYQADGSLDNTFSSDGKVTTNVGGFFDKIYALAIQPDGKIVVGGNLGESANSDFAQVRYQSNGALDATFGTNGVTKFSIGTSFDELHSIALQPDGKIVAAGFTNNGTDYDFAVARFNANGTPDLTFNGTGKQITPIGTHGDYGQSVAVQPDGGVVVLGYTAISTLEYGFALVRYLPNGLLDPVFGDTGVVVTSFSSSFDEGLALTLQPDGKILAGGYAAGDGHPDFAVARYLANGILDEDFGLFGVAKTDFLSGTDQVMALTIAPDGKIVAAGRSNNGINFDFAVARYLSGLSVGVVDFSRPDASLFIAPNPVHDKTVLTYELANDAVLSLALFDFSGRQVQTFFEKAIRSQGIHHEALTFGENMPAGNYILVLTNERGESQRVQIAKE